MAHRARSYQIEGSPHCPWLIVQQMPTQRLITRVLIAIAVAGLVLGLAASAVGKAALASGLWAAGVLPVIVALFVAIVHELLAGRLGVDADGNRDENPGDEALCR